MVHLTERPSRPLAELRPPWEPLSSGAGQLSPGEAVSLVQLAFLTVKGSNM